MGVGSLLLRRGSKGSNLTCQLDGKGLDPLVKVPYHSSGWTGKAQMGLEFVVVRMLHLLSFGQAVVTFYFRDLSMYVY